jgi:4-hydroxythreonine-4-phosphate dehydrogenase
MSKPRVGVVLGDPGGIGAELIAGLAARPETRERAHVTVIGDPWLLRRGAAEAGIVLDLPLLSGAGEVGRREGLAMLPMDSLDESSVRLGEATASGGRSALDALDSAITLARNGQVDAVMFGPLNKQALHLAGFGFEDELRWLASRLDYNGYVTELNVVDTLWTSRVTSHVPHKDVAQLIDIDGIVQSVELIDAELRRAGVAGPRIGVAGLNPHAGDGGNFGREEIDIIGPAVEQARARGLCVSGPYPADTIFVRAQSKEFDGIVTMYHDQGQIAMKLMGFGRAVTVQGGLPVPVTTPGHGTAYEIAGRGIAKTGSTEQAFVIACRMGANRRDADSQNVPR